jgi:hypothetical protein
MAYQGMYAADGTWNVHVVDGLSKVDLYTADGCLNVTGSAGTGIMHPSGAMAVTTPPGGVFVGRQAPDGSLYLNSIPDNNGAQNCTFIP